MAQVAKWREWEDNWLMTVAAITAVLGGDKILKRSVSSDADLMAMTHDGLPVDTLTQLAQELSVDRKTLAKVVGISERTLSRRLSKSERLTADESDRTVRLARLVAMATYTLGTSENASSWLQTRNRALDGRTPFELLNTDAGTQAVETVLLRIEYGLYS